MLSQCRSEEVVGWLNRTTADSWTSSPSARISLTSPGRTAGAVTPVSGTAYISGVSANAASAAGASGVAGSAQETMIDSCSAPDGWPGSGPERTDRGRSGISPVRGALTPRTCAGTHSLFRL
jgi:hypothetical protein